MTANFSTEKVAAKNNKTPFVFQNERGFSLASARFGLD
ncbi:MAG: hypothetical protein CEO19_470, partial [Parcubacteria group bacterium Gr01-1014_73]